MEVRITRHIFRNTGNLKIHYTKPGRKIYSEDLSNYIGFSKKFLSCLLSNYYAIRLI